MGLSSHDLGRLLLSMPDQPEVVAEGELVTGAEVSTYDDGGPVQKPCVVLECEE